MGRLIQIEWLKLKSYKTFWFFALSYLILLPLLLFSFHKFEIRVHTTTLGFEFYHFPDVWHNVTYLAGWFNILLYFFMILLLTNEFQYRTFRQHIIDGMSKFEVLASKLVMVFGITLFSTVFVACAAFASGYLMSETFQMDTAWSKTTFVYGYFVQLLGYLIFALFLSLILQRQGMAMIVFILYSLIIENLLRFRLLPEPFKDYLPLNTFSNLIPNPFPAFFGQPVPLAPDPKDILVSCGYMLLFIGLSYLWLEKRSF